LFGNKLKRGAKDMNTVYVVESHILRAKKGHNYSTNGQKLDDAEELQREEGFATFEEAKEYFENADLPIDEFQVVLHYEYDDDSCEVETVANNYKEKLEAFLEQTNENRKHFWPEYNEEIFKVEQPFFY
jgi:hypothetical protein